MKINNVKLLKEGLYEISRGFESIARAIADSEDGTNVTPLTEVPEVEVPLDEVTPEEATEIVEEAKKEVADTETGEILSLDKEALDKMTYRDLQKLAKDLDVLATGKKEELVARISGEEVVVVEELSEEVEEIVEEVVEIQEEIEIEEEEVEESKVLTKADKVEKALVDYSEEDLADVLDSIGVSPKGKRQALLAKIVKAIEEGKLELELEDDEEVEEAPEVEEVVEEEMTEARRQRVSEVKEEVKKMIENGEMSEDDINNTLAYVYAKDGFKPTLPLKERQDMIEEMYVNLVDDEGQSQELETPYELNEEYACCSHILDKQESGELHCKVCNQAYEIG